MFTLTCPKCQKNSYSADEQSFHSCPYCGFRFSRKYGPDRRHEKRIKQEINFGFPCHEQHFEATTVDFSEKGLSAKIEGETPVTVGEIMDLSIGDLQIRAKVVWVNKLSNNSMVGLQKLN